MSCFSVLLAVSLLLSFPIIELGTPVVDQSFTAGSGLTELLNGLNSFSAQTYTAG